MQYLVKLSFSIKRKYLFNGRKSIKERFCRKNSTDVLAVGYNPREVEKSAGIRTREPEIPYKRGSFRMMLPPPNVTGQLHLGHALMATVQDVICRRHRQLNYEVEWIPGTDHAGIATQVVVEKKLQNTCGKTRHHIGRDAFIKEVWKWKTEKSVGIVQDLKKLGCTLNWEQEYFTMDDQQARAVNLAFIKLFEAGLIQRKKSLINWSCTLESAISDIEVDTLEINGPTEIAVPGYEKNIEFGLLYNISYKLCNRIDEIEEIIVSTTRPETILGDVAVAVNPDDVRYQKLRSGSGVQLWHPLRKQTIPLIFDDNVDQNFGTGAVKITPAHDKLDFEIAQRHLLEEHQVFDEKGIITSEYKNFEGLPRFEAREHVLQVLKELGLLRGIKDHVMNLPICSRSKDIVEYILREQWFLKCHDMANSAITEVRKGRLQIFPSTYENDWYRWLENCHDWCISRQLWWGHQIPAYSAQDKNGTSCWVAALSEQEALEKAKIKLKCNEVHIERDEDVLDTWFSSALLPFSVLGWPNETFKQRYPLDLLETGHDILFFWVARMVMLGLQITGEIPFKKILLNGIICDVHGRKMSKSLGNAITPQQVIEGATLKELQKAQQTLHENGIISSLELKRSQENLQKEFPTGIQECGTDALRLTLCSHNIKNRFINFDFNECYTNKRFLNKIWQATRFLLGAAENLNISLNELRCLSNVELSLWDRWILSRLADTLKKSSNNLNDFNFHTEIAAFKQFFYSNLCDVYIETTKPMIAARHPRGYSHCSTLAVCLSWGIEAIKPFTPFVSEALLRHLPRRIQLNLEDYRDVELEKQIDEILFVCDSIRKLLSQNKISKKHEPELVLYAHSSETCEKLSHHLLEIKALTSTKDIQLKQEPQPEAYKGFKFFSTAGHLCSFGILTNDKYNPIQSNISSAVNLKKLTKLQAELEVYVMRAENEGFRRSASKEIQQKHLEKIKKLQTEIKNIEALTN